MTEIFGVPLPVVLSQLLLDLVNGLFYAVLSLGLVVIFELLNTINFARGASFMLDTALTWMGFSYLGVPYWTVLALSPLVIGLLDVVVERTLLRFVYKLGHLYGLLLTLDMALVIEGMFRAVYGASDLSYDTPQLLQGTTDLGLMILPNYCTWMVVASLAVCFATRFMIEKAGLGAHLHVGTENSGLVGAFDVSMPLMVTLAYSFGVALATFTGVLMVSVIRILPLMGQSMTVTVLTVVAIGGTGPIFGSIVTGLSLGMIEGLTRVFYPQASATVMFIIVVLVLLVRPVGLFGKEKRVVRPT